MPDASSDDRRLLIGSRPLVTVVTPSLNQAEFIRGTIESVLAQDYPNIEYLVQDGGSTDGTLEILREYSSSVNWQSGRDDGQINALNRAARIEVGADRVHHRSGGSGQREGGCPSQV